ncbi:sulfotransferase [Puniceibacterium sp. IMCC21224]|uniref:tetratricopeptide repeat-containing sulfotransferase family protein n=1 Tax=Puniceibacterium sp. IMCC21224 TaxID=1618204 RepID=UPI00064DA2AF|nr:sulfotransferase [Puniceibacterium sp. IMCC21224]KMK68741.1 Sulfotransferase family [Puniceibacterium sp. IMCC21224]
MLPLSTPQKAGLQRQAQAAIARANWPQARNALKQLALAEPHRGDYPYQLSQIAFEEGDRAACLTLLGKALALAPTNTTLLAAAIDRYRHFDLPDKALAAYDRLIDADRSATKPRADKAHYLQLLGRFDEAETLFRKLIKQHPRETELYRIFLGTKKLALGDPIVRAMEKLWAVRELDDRRRMNLGFALAKVMEDTGQTARVFAYLRRANDLQRKDAPFDRSAQAREFAKVRAAQNALPTAPVGADLPMRPVFVTGMPRSGTTLVERILAAHSQVTAGEELALALKLSYRMFGAGEAMRPLNTEPRERLRHFAESYVKLVGRDLGEATPVFTDKSIQNHLIYGLLNATLPGARIIVVHRDPRDIALSIYKNHFNTGTHRYSSNLADIAEVIKRFRDSVAHWKTQLPGVLHEVHYEALTAEPEAQSRALVAAAGLDWEDACLDFHNAGGTVRTLSVSQVRQPIYRGSSQAWRKYETELAPFFDAWGDTPWD